MVCEKGGKVWGVWGRSVPQVWEGWVGYRWWCGGVGGVCVHASASHTQQTYDATVVRHVANQEKRVIGAIHVQTVGRRGQGRWGKRNAATACRQR